VAFRLNPPPGWPPVPEGFVPPPGWQPDPSWPPPPPGWQLWIPDATPGAGPGAGAAGPGSYYQIPPGSGTSGFAIASFILGILGLFTISAILSIIFGIVALVKIRNVPQKGKGFAIAGLVLSGIWLAALAVLIAIGVATAPHSSAGHPASGPVRQPGGVDIFTLRVAECFDYPHGQSVSSVALIPCTQPHDTQVFAQFDLTGPSSSYPGATRLKQQATSGCNSRIAGNLDRSKITNTLSVRFIFPLPGSWDLGHRSVSCLVVDPTPDLTSSLLIAHPRG
jgi:Domain of unknown function (DUF4190)/Septum formation